jgi:ADP-ribose pyrophosphatase YjhB (NUDIX family)
MVKHGFVLVRYYLSNEEHVDDVVRELLEKTGLTLTFHDLTMLSDALVRVALPEGHRQLVYVFSASVPVPYVTSYLRTLAKLEHVVLPNRLLIRMVLTWYRKRLTLTVFLLRRPNMGCFQF